MSNECEIPKHAASPEDIKEILRDHKTVAIVGASPKKARPSYAVAKYLKDNGYKIYPVNPGCEEVLGEKCWPDLDSIPDKVDIVDVFRKPEFAPEIAKKAVAIGAKVLWMQEMVISNEAGNIAKNGGLKVVMNKCMLKEHSAMEK
jgi:hypothetical protein